MFLGRPAVFKISTLSGFFDCLSVYIIREVKPSLRGTSLTYVLSKSNLTALDLFYSPLVKLIILSFVFVAAVEEALKYWIVRKKIWDHPAFDEYFDGIMYAVTASLGFAALENVFYVTDGGLYVGVIRALMAVPAHALFGAMMGYYIGLARFEKNPDKTNSTKRIII